VSVEWFADLAKLTPQVEALFAQNSNRLRPPSQDGCKTFASALMVVRARKKAPRKEDKTEASIAGAHRSAVALLRHLKPIKRKLTGLIDDVWEPSVMQSTIEHYNGKLAQLDLATKAVETLLIALDEPPISPWPEGNPVLFIAQKAQEAWSGTNAGAAPKSKNSDDPLVQVVTGALELVGIHKAPATVSAVLKGRR
jgi:hypothetical protein